MELKSVEFSSPIHTSGIMKRWKHDNYINIDSVKSDFILICSPVPSPRPSKIPQPSISLDETRQRSFWTGTIIYWQKQREGRSCWGLMELRVLWHSMDGMLCSLSYECEKREGRGRLCGCNFILVRLQLLHSASQNFAHSANLKQELQSVSLLWFWAVKLVVETAFHWIVGAVASLHFYKSLNVQRVFS